MNEMLRRYLSPQDDGAAFTEAVLLRASGALYRRRRGATEGPTWSLLEYWARPWLIAALLVVAIAMAIPSLPGSPNGGAADSSAVADVVGGTAGLDVVLVAALGN